MKKFYSVLAFLLINTSFAATIQVVSSFPDGTSGPETYTQPQKSKKRWRIGVVVPTLKDSFWLAINYGLVAEAKRLGVSLRIMTANGYTDLAGQNALLDKMSKEKLDIMIIAPINGTRQNIKIEKIIHEKKIPVIGFVNPIKTSSAISRVESSYYDGAYKVAEYLMRVTRNRSAKVAILPGPAGSGWAEKSYNGFKDALTETYNKNVHIDVVRWGDTSKVVQTRLINGFLGKEKDVKYIIGNPVTADAAASLFRASPRKMNILATYSNPSTYKLINSGEVEMAVTDYTSVLGRLAIDIAVDVLEKRRVYALIGTRFDEVTKKNINSIRYSDMFAPENYKATHSVNW